MRTFGSDSIALRSFAPTSTPYHSMWTWPSAFLGCRSQKTSCIQVKNNGCVALALTAWQEVPTSFDVVGSFSLLHRKSVERPARPARALCERRHQNTIEERRGNCQPLATSSASWKDMRHNSQSSKPASLRRRPLIVTHQSQASMGFRVAELSTLEVSSRSLCQTQCWHL